MSKQSTDPRTTVQGKLTFHSETGTEGGHWAIQDRRYIKENVTRYSCTKCGIAWDSEKQTQQDVIEYVKNSSSSLLEGCRGCVHDFKLSPPELWSYEGLHVLKNGDFLKIYSKDNSKKTIWSGIILLHDHPLFTEHVNGMWMNTDQVGVNRDVWAKWFFEEYPAELMPCTGV
jgi:3-dehydroquinate dehydratase